MSRPLFTPSLEELVANLNPIETAPLDGRFVQLYGPSGYVTTPLRSEICFYDPDYKLAPWRNHANDAFTDGGEPPTHWLPWPAPAPNWTDPAPPDDWKPDYNLAPRRIVSAAMTRDGKLIASPRHMDKIARRIVRATDGKAYWRNAEQGFVDQFGDFLTREEAWIVAEAQGQIIRQTSTPGTLYSENLY